jgi:signal recognition particle subunit SRP54
MFDNLTDKIDKALHVLKGHGSITEINVAETLKESDLTYKYPLD